MKNLNEHRALETKLRNQYGYTGMKTITNTTTNESTIIMKNKADADEMYEIFGEQGYSFGFDKK